MPQKAIFQRAPLLTLTGVPLSPGQIRVTEEKISALYALTREDDRPETWEGAFGLACLLKDRPLEEPVAGRIRAAVFATAEGAFPGSWEQQIRTAGAALALHACHPDREILRRLASWCRTLEAEWDAVMAIRNIRIRPADLMGFLVTFYRITGVKAILRLCERLRASAMDWTSALQEFHQRIPIEKQMSRDELNRLIGQEPADEADYFARQLIVNDGELLADGLRYTVYAAMYSGNGQDLSAAHNGWNAIGKDHGAVCGGTTGERFLAGRGTDQPVRTGTAAAWAEAFAAALQLAQGDWAADALTRLAWNALPACLTEGGLSGSQRINTLSGQGTLSAEPAGSETVGRLARAYAALYRSAVMATEDGARLNLLLPGRYALTVHQQPVSVVIRKDGIQIASGCGEPIRVMLYLAGTETRTPERLAEEQAGPLNAGKGDTGFGKRLEITVPAGGTETLRLAEGEALRTLETHHQGICVFRANRLMVMDTAGTDFRVVACGAPTVKEGTVRLPVRKTAAWKERGGMPGEIPVRPEGYGDVFEVPLQPYAETSGRITVFPKERKS